MWPFLCALWFGFATSWVDLSHGLFSEKLSLSDLERKLPNRWSNQFRLLLLIGVIISVITSSFFLMVVIFILIHCFFKTMWSCMCLFFLIAKVAQAEIDTKMMKALQILVLMEYDMPFLSQVMSFSLSNNKST